MNKLDALLMERDARVSLAHRWMSYDEIWGWTVWERKPYAKKTTIRIQTASQEDAIEVLRDEE